MKSRWLGKKPYLIYLLPSLIVVFSVLVGLSIFSLNMSFHDYNVFKEEKPFIGLANYREAMNDPVFMQSLYITFIYISCAITSQILLGLGIALFLNKRVGTYSSLINMIIVLPVMMSPIGVGILWRLMYNEDFGVINFLLGRVGLPQPYWLSDPSSALPAIIVTDSWHWTPFVAIIIYAGLRMIPTEYYEAASIDGASSWKKFRQITLPLIKGVLLVALIFRLADGFRMFDEIRVMTWGGPMYSTYTAVYGISRNALMWFDFGMASAQSFIFEFMVILITLPLIRISRRGR